MTRNDLILMIESQLINKNEITISKETAKKIIDIIKKYDKIIDERLRILTEIKSIHQQINERRDNALEKADEDDYHRRRYLTEKEKLDILDEVIELFFE